MLIVLTGGEMAIKKRPGGRFLYVACCRRGKSDDF